MGYGFIDKSFNITKNHGIDAEENIVLIDLGELLFDENKKQRQIKNRAWIKYYVVDHLRGKELQDYFIKRMDEEFLRNL